MQRLQREIIALEKRFIQAQDQLAEKEKENSELQNSMENSVASLLAISQDEEAARLKLKALEKELLDKCEDVKILLVQNQEKANEISGLKKELDVVWALQSQD